MKTTTILPKHIAIIMDGNRRWARERGLPILAGHKKVADEILEPLVEHAAKLGIQYITFWAFSTENWQRDKQEVSGIMRIFRHVIQKRWQRLHEKGVRVQVIGDIAKFPDDIQRSLKAVIEQTKHNKKITAVFALNYGGRDELLRAMNKAISYQLSAISLQKDQKICDGFAESCKLTAESYAQYLDTSQIPDPEMIIRTGGEQRLSGFLPWQSEYSELFFPAWYMPEFTPQKLDGLVAEFQGRKRRFGK